MKGKIARLPKAVQEALNRRMQDGERGKPLVAWLNGLPEVKKALKSEFEDPIREQNLSEWRKRGYQQWLWREEAKEMARDMAEEATELQTSGVQSLTEQMAQWVTVRYLMAVRKLIESSQKNEPNKEPDIKVLRNFLQDVVTVRRGDLSAARLKVAQERSDRERQWDDADIVTYFQDWVEHFGVRKLIRDESLTREERRERLAELCSAKEEGRMQNDEGPSGRAPSEPPAEAVVKTRKRKKGKPAKPALPKIQKTKAQGGEQRSGGMVPKQIKTEQVDVKVDETDKSRLLTPPLSSFGEERERTLAASGDGQASCNTEAHLSVASPPHPASGHLLPRGGEGTGAAIRDGSASGSTHPNTSAGAHGVTRPTSRSGELTSGGTKSDLPVAVPPHPASGHLLPRGGEGTHASRDEEASGGTRPATIGGAPAYVETSARQAQQSAECDVRNAERQVQSGAGEVEQSRLTSAATENNKPVPVAERKSGEPVTRRCRHVTDHANQSGRAAEGYI